MNIVRILVALGLSLDILACLCSFLGPWPGDMITPFRLYLWAAALLALAVAAPMRRLWLTGLATGVVILTGLPGCAAYGTPCPALTGHWDAPDARLQQCSLR